MSKRTLQKAAVAVAALMILPATSQAGHERLCPELDRVGTGVVRVVDGVGHGLRRVGEGVGHGLRRVGDGVHRTFRSVFHDRRS